MKISTNVVGYAMVVLWIVGGVVFVTSCTHEATASLPEVAPGYSDIGAYCSIYGHRIYANSGSGDIAVIEDGTCPRTAP